MVDPMKGFDKKQRTAFTNTNELRWLVNHNYINVDVDFFRTENFTPPEGWMDANKWNAKASSPESEQHKKFKVLAAVYLDLNGCELAKTKEDLLPNNNADWEYICFEHASEYGRADLTCLNCINVVECGTTEPKKCIDAFGIDAQPQERRIVWDKELLSDENTLNIWNYDTPVKKFITMPYTGTVKNEDREVIGYKMFIYTRGAKLD
jgi:hypothetical protein